MIRKDRAGGQAGKPGGVELRAKAEEMAGGSEAATDRVRQRVEKAEADLERLEEGVKSARGLSPPNARSKQIQTSP
jgi:hypothetical protein